MGKLFFYSDQVTELPSNRRLDDLLFTDMKTESIKVSYIPSTDDKARRYFNAKEQYYREYGIPNIMFFDLYSDFDRSRVEELVSFDIIHLSAGNPIEFSKALKHRKMETVCENILIKEELL